MATFTFRAAAALDLRLRQEQQAGTALAAAEAACRAAEARLEEAEAARRLAQEQQASAERRGSDIGTLTWHRNWVVRLGRVVDDEREAVRQHQEAVDEAKRVWQEARRKRLTLERLRDRAWRRHLDEERKAEMKVIDELARLRFVLAEQGQ